jgi:hypothetical protein
MIILVDGGGSGCRRLWSELVMAVVVVVVVEGGDGGRWREGGTFWEAADRRGKLEKSRI